MVSWVASIIGVVIGLIIANLLKEAVKALYQNGRVSFRNQKLRDKDIVSLVNGGEINYANNQLVLTYSGSPIHLVEKLKKAALKEFKEVDGKVTSFHSSYPGLMDPKEEE